MKIFLPFIGIIIFLFLLPGNALSQANQTISNGALTTVVNFVGTGCVYNWVNDNPAIGLPASGTGNIASFIAVNTGNTAVTATITATPAAAVSLAYIANAGLNTVSIIDVATNTVVGSINVDISPVGVCISPDGGRVYVTCQNSNTVTVINAFTNKVITSVNVGANPFGIAISPDGSRLYVANTIGGTVSVINTMTNTLIGTITTGTSPEQVAVSPDGKLIYVTNLSGIVSVINTVTQSIVATITVSSKATGISISPDGSKIYVCNFDLGTISVINTSNNAVISTITLGSPPLSLTISTDGSRLYVTNGSIGTVSVINTLTNTVISNIPVGAAGVSLSPDGSLLYAVNTTSNTVSVIKTATNTVITTIPVGISPTSYGKFITAGTNCTGLPVTFTITVNPTPPAPTITTTGILPALTTVYGTPSSLAAFTVSGANLTAGILITEPAGFEVSTNNTNFNKIVSVGTAGNIANTLVYVRLASTTPVGTYSGNIVISSPGAASVNLATANSTVTPAPLTITADNKSRIFGADNPALTVTYTGFVNNDGPVQLTTQPIISTTAIISSPIGKYPITASGAASTNYNFIYVPGVFTITPSLTIPNTFTPNGDGINDTWVIKNIEYYPNSTVEIFNRYGEKLYFSNSYPIPWNGSYNGVALPAGTYYYIINPGAGITAMAGWVAIVR